MLRHSGTDLQTIEVKRAAGGFPSSVVDTLSAFANADGGLLILGVSEEEGFRAVNIDAPLIASALASACSDRMEPPVRARIDIAELDEKPVVIALIDPLDASRKPCFVKTRGMHRGSYFRTHDGDRLLTTYEIQVLTAAHSQPMEDMEPIPGATQADLDPELVQSLIRRLRATRGRVYRDATDEQILLYNGVCLRGDETPKITLAGLLALGRMPQQYLPQLNVTFVVSPTLTGEPLHDGTRFLDSQSIDGSIPVMLEEVLAAMRRNMKRRSVVIGIGREDRWEYPEQAVRELVANALMHRDYHASARGTQVRVTLFPDRLEVSSPGGLFGSVEKDALMTDIVTSSRNSRLTKLLEDVVMAGTTQTVCENRGTGLIATAQALRLAGIEPPEISDLVREFRITIRNQGLLDEEALQWLSELDTEGLEDRQRVALGFLFHHRSITNERYRTVVGCDSLTATRDLTALASLGLVEKQSDRRWATWHLIKPLATTQQFEEPGQLAPTRLSGKRHRADRRDQIRALLTNRTMNAQELADAIGIKPPAVNHWLRKMEASGELRRAVTAQPGQQHRWELA